VIVSCIRQGRSRPFFSFTSGGFVWHFSFWSRTSVRGIFFSALSAILLALPVTASAQDRYWQASIGSNTTSYALTAEAACSSAMDKNLANGGTGSFDSAQPVGASFACMVKRPSGSVFQGGNATLRVCPAQTPYFIGAVPAGGTIPCSGEKAPEVDPCSDKNPFIRRWNGAGAPNHYSGCVVVPLEMMVCRKDSNGPYCMWMVKRTGNRYTGPEGDGGGTDTPEKPSDPPVTSPPFEAPPAAGDQSGKGPCPAGTVHAGMSQSGIPMCVGTGTTTPAKAAPPKNEVDKTETLPDGSTQNTKTVTVTNSDGSTTKTTTTTITRTDGSKDTSQTASTSTTPSGKPGSADRPVEDDKYDMCKTNPNLSICRESSVTGTCGQIQCMGDAVQCATLRATAAMQCSQESADKEARESKHFKDASAAAAGNDPMKDQLPTAANASVVEVGGLKQDGWLGDRAGIDDVAFTVLNRQFVIPFSEVSQYLLGLRYALMVVAGLLSFKTLRGAILS